MFLNILEHNYTLIYLPDHSEIEYFMINHIKYVRGETAF